MSLLMADPHRSNLGEGRFVAPSRPLDEARACKQWRDLRSILEGLQHDVHMLQGHGTSPFVNDPVITALGPGGPSYVCGRLRGQRAAEVPVQSTWLRDHGHQRRLWTAAGYLAGGDLQWCGSAWFVGFGGVSALSAGRAAATALGSDFLPLQLVDARWPVLDQALTILDEDHALWVPEAFDENGRVALESWFPHLEAVSFAGALALKEHVVVEAAHADSVRAIMSLGFEPVRVDLSAWEPAGASVSGLVCRIHA